MCIFIEDTAVCGSTEHDSACVRACVQAMEIEVPNIPHIPERGSHMVYFDPSDLYIDASDFREVTLQMSYAFSFYMAISPLLQCDDAQLICPIILV